MGKTNKKFYILRKQDKTHGFLNQCFKNIFYYSTLLIKFYLYLRNFAKSSIFQENLNLQNKNTMSEFNEKNKKTKCGELNALVVEKMCFGDFYFIKKICLYLAAFPVLIH